jgi:Iron-containing alcohol dehydrogenase
MRTRTAPLGRKCSRPCGRRAAGVRFACAPHVFPGTPTLRTSYEQVTVVRELLAALPDAVCCAIAAGTINDVVKLASGELGRPYLVVCTAASVDGYTAFGASIARDGFKITRPCPAPAALIADTVVMADAPQRLTASGYGDLIEKLPAGADWILADEIGVESVRPEIWESVQPPAREALADPDLVAAGELEAVASLAEANLLSGLGMQAMRSSRPASGAGHLMPPEIVDKNDYQIPSWPSTPEGEERQADELVRHYTTLFLHPAVAAATYRGLADDGAWLGAPPASSAPTAPPNRPTTRCGPSCGETGGCRRRPSAPTRQAASS